MIATKVPASDIHNMPAFDFNQLFSSIFEVKRLPSTPIQKTSMWRMRRKFQDLLTTQPNCVFRWECGAVWVDDKKNVFYATPIDKAGLIISPKVTEYKSYVVADRLYDLEKSGVWANSNWVKYQLTEKYDVKKILKTINPYRSSFDQQMDHSLVWENMTVHLFYEGFKKARLDRRDFIREKIKAGDPAFLEVQSATADTEKTLAALHVAGKLSKLTAVITDIMSGLEKGTVSPSTVKSYSTMMSEMGRDKRDIVGNLQKFFVQKSRKK